MENLKRKANQSFIVNEKKRKIAADDKAQRMITDFFKSTKKSKCPGIELQPLNYKLEKLIVDTRGANSNIKILWLPKKEELNPVSYVSLYFCKQVAETLNVEDIKVIEACKKVVDTLPNDLWRSMMSYVEELEEQYVNEYLR